MVNDKAIRAGVISGVLSSLLMLVLIEPILALTWHVIIRLADSLHHGIADWIYSAAARFNAAKEVEAWGALILLTVAALFLMEIARTIGPWERLVALYQAAPEWLLARLVRTGRVAIPFFGLAVLVEAMLFSAVLLGISNIRASFDQRLTVLAPAISEAEYKTLEAQFAQMRGKTDYDMITSTMDQQARTVGITLPPPRNP